MNVLFPLINLFFFDVTVVKLLCRRAASYGAKVAIVEKARLGGTCVNVGMILNILYFTFYSWELFTFLCIMTYRSFTLFVSSLHIGCVPKKVMCTLYTIFIQRSDVHIGWFMYSF